MAIPNRKLIKYSRPKKSKEPKVRNLVTKYINSPKDKKTRTGGTFSFTTNNFQKAKISIFELMRIVFATHNPNKIREVLHLLPKHIDLLSLTDIGCVEEIPETGQTLEENALLKAQYVVRNYGHPCFADDTGLIVDALDGAPGVYSARYAGTNKNADANMAKLLSEMKKKPNRSARFKTVIALFLEGEQQLFTGKVEGEIIHEKKGEQGFGYDPVFKPVNFDKTFAELPLSVKNKIGHRGKAIRKLVDYLKNIDNTTE